MRIKYTVSTMIFWGRENPLSFDQECHFLKSLGFGIELWPNIMGQDECRYAKRNWPRLADATEGMLVSMRSRTDNPTLEQWEEQIQCAKTLGAAIITSLESLHIPLGLDLNGCGLAGQVIGLAKDNNVELCIETGPLNLLKQIGKRFDSLRYCLDTGYANIDPENSFRDYVDELADKVVALHLTDNYGQVDDHEPPGLNGGIKHEDWDYLLTALSRYENEVVASLEMCPCTPEVMIHQASDFLFNKLKWPNSPQNCLTA